VQERAREKERETSEKGRRKGEGRGGGRGRGAERRGTGTRRRAPVASAELARCRRCSSSALTLPLGGGDWCPVCRWCPLCVWLVLPPPPSSPSPFLCLSVVRGLLGRRTDGGRE
jgi:hypothetical protein